MPNERAVLCGGVADEHLPLGGKPLRLRLWGRHRNVELGINDISKALAADVPPAFVDLVEIATYVYCADQAVTRGGSDVENLGADWRRRLHFRIPVRALDLWSGDPARSALATTLGFLSEDDYTFEFVELKEGASLRDYLFPSGDVTSDRIEEVVLFSGGLDSLGGAVREAVTDKRRVALVTHQPSSKLVRRYTKIREELTARATRAPLFVPVTINKQKILGREYTQRSRSFLYMALAAAVAQMLGLARIRFYENGIVSFNFPPSGQIVGAKATRTTHPQVLKGFADILSLVAGRRFDVENPFLWSTKAEIVQQIVSAGCADLIPFSTSCTHTWEMTNAHPHCGSCSQCIDRRFAVLAAGAGDADPKEAYKVDLLVGERPADEPGDKRTIIASYIETANEVTRMSPVAFFSKFGEASRVLRHLEGSAATVALKVYELHKRHAQQVTAVVDEAISTHARAIRERSLPAMPLS
jgi:7-cyano-7-deazaguanine synthase in queuosine biosynthesis